MSDKKLRGGPGGRVDVYRQNKLTVNVTQAEADRRRGSTAAPADVKDKRDIFLGEMLEAIIAQIRLDAGSPQNASLQTDATIGILGGQAGNVMTKDMATGEITVQSKAADGGARLVIFKGDNGDAADDATIRVDITDGGVEATRSLKIVGEGVTAAYSELLKGVDDEVTFTISAESADKTNVQTASGIAIDSKLALESYAVSANEEKMTKGTDFDRTESASQITLREKDATNVATAKSVVVTDGANSLSADATRVDIVASATKHNKQNATQVVLTDGTDSLSADAKRVDIVAGALKYNKQDADRIMIRKDVDVYSSMTASEATFEDAASKTKAYVRAKGIELRDEDDNGNTERVYLNTGETLDAKLRITRSVGDDEYEVLQADSNFISLSWTDRDGSDDVSQVYLQTNNSSDPKIKLTDEDAAGELRRAGELDPNRLILREFGEKDEDEDSIAEIRADGNSQGPDFVLANNSTAGANRSKESTMSLRGLEVSNSESISSLAVKLDGSVSTAHLTTDDGGNADGAKLKLDTSADIEATLFAADAESGLLVKKGDRSFDVDATASEVSAVLADGKTTISLKASDNKKLSIATELDGTLGFEARVDCVTYDSEGEIIKDVDGNDVIVKRSRLDIPGNAKVNNTLEVWGDMVVKGMTTTTAQEQVIVKDPLMTLGGNNPAAGLDLGLLLEQAGVDNQVIYYDSSEDIFRVRPTTAAGDENNLDADHTNDPTAHTDFMMKDLFAENATFDEDVLGLGTLDILEAATLRNTLTVHSESALLDTLTVHGYTWLKDELKVDLFADFLSDVDVHGKLNVDGNSTMGGTLGVAKDASLGSKLDVAGDTTVAGDGSFERDLFVDQIVQLRGPDSYIAIPNNEFQMHDQHSYSVRAYDGDDADFLDAFSHIAPEGKPASLLAAIVDCASDGSVQRSVFRVKDGCMIPARSWRGKVDPFYDERLEVIFSSDDEQGFCRPWYEVCKQGDLQIAFNGVAGNPDDDFRTLWDGYSMRASFDLFEGDTISISHPKIIMPSGIDPMGWQIFEEIEAYEPSSEEMFAGHSNVDLADRLLAVFVDGICKERDRLLSFYPVFMHQMIRDAYAFHIRASIDTIAGDWHPDYKGGFYMMRWGRRHGDWREIRNAADFLDAMLDLKFYHMNKDLEIDGELVEKAQWSTLSAEQVEAAAGKLAELVCDCPESFDEDVEKGKGKKEKKPEGHYSDKA